MPRSLVLIAGLAAGCGGAGVPATVPPTAEECVLWSGADTGSGPLIAAAAGRDSELVSSARGRAPLGFSCTGRPVPRLASAWTSDSSRTAWTLVLPAAGELAASWRSRADAAAALRAAGVVSALPLDEHRLTVTFRSAQDSVPGVFAHAALAAPAGVLDSSGPRLVPGSAADLRDALDGGAAVVVTADPTVLDYAATRAELHRHLLPWNRIYVLVAPAGAAPLVDLAPGDSATFRASLARDAVRVLAREAAAPYWWEAASGCARAAAARGEPAGDVVYPRGDPVARGLAERLVAMAGPGHSARAVPDGDLAAALERGAASGYVVSLPRRPLLPCAELAAWPEGATVLPLLETRPTAIVRAGTPALTVDYDGGLLLQKQR